jgi:FtsH-binding integral membrane protein
MSQDEVSDQMKFVRKVYCILASQLTLTAAFIAIVQVSDKMKGFFSTSAGLGLSITAAILSIVFMCMIVCCFRKKTPHNYVLLFLFTVCESYMVGGLTARYE